MQLTQRIAIITANLGPHLKQHGLEVLLAESCTGGQLAAAITQCAGSSDWFSHSLVTYSNQAKMDYLNVSPEILENDGAVSEACARAMVCGLNPKKNQVALATTGFAGPSGEAVGTVFLAWSIPQHEIACERLNLSGSRSEIVLQVVFLALRGLILRTLYPPAYQHLNYFFALVCEADIQASCFTLGMDAGIELNDLEPLSNLHLTLSYLGKLQEEERQTWMRKAKLIAQTQPAFSLELLGIDYWQRPDAYVIECELTPELLALATDLGAKPGFKPHISLSKHNRIHLAELPKKNLSKQWQIKRFALCVSWHSAIYIEHANWPLSTS